MQRPWLAPILRTLLAGAVLAPLFWTYLLQSGGDPAAAAEDLLVNPDFETSIDGVPQGWSASGGSLFTTSTVVHGGSHAALFESDAPQWIYQVVPVTAGSYYTLTGHIVKNDENVKQAILRMLWFSSPDGTGPLILESSSPALTANNPSYAALTLGRVKAPVGARSARVMVVLFPESYVAARIYIDDLRLVVEGTSSTATPTPSPSPTATATASSTSTATPTHNGFLAGSVIPQGRGRAPNPRWSVPLTVTLYEPGAITPAFQYSPATDSSGRFTATEFVPGVYDVVVQKSHALPNRIAMLELGSCEAFDSGTCPTIDFGVLLEGDVDQSGDIDETDRSRLTSAYFGSWGEAGFDGQVDLNEDGRINALDYAVLASNYLKGGAAGHRLAGYAGRAMSLKAAFSTPAVEPGEVLITEVQYDPSPAGVDSDYEWLELYNASGRTISLDWLTIGDNGVTSTLPVHALTPGQYVVVAATASFLALFSGFSGTVVYGNGGRLGNGLSNTGDRLILRDSRGTIVDAVSYGTDRSIFDPPCPTVSAGQSVERTGHADTGTSADFQPNSNPSPGSGFGSLPVPTISHSPVSFTATATPSMTPAASPTSTSTANPTASVSPTPAAISPGEVLITEVQYDPSPSGIDSDYEWFELLNASNREVSLDWLTVSDNSATSSLPHFVLAPGRYVVVAATAGFTSLFPDFPGSVLYLDSGRIGNGLSNSGDRLILSDGRGSIVDAISYGSDKSPGIAGRP